MAFRDPFFVGHMVFLIALLAAPLLVEQIKNSYPSAYMGFAFLALFSLEGGKIIQLIRSINRAENKGVTKNRIRILPI